MQYMTLNLSTEHLKKQEERRPKPVAGRILELKRAEETDTDFAYRLGLTPQIISNWRAGLNEASLDAVVSTLRKIKAANPWYLLLGKGAPELVEPGEAEDRLRAIQQLANPGMGDIKTVLRFFKKLGPKDDAGEKTA
jgi:hypothetical protein